MWSILKKIFNILLGILVIFFAFDLLNYLTIESLPYSYSATGFGRRLEIFLYLTIGHKATVCFFVLLGVCGILAQFDYFGLSLRKIFRNRKVRRMNDLVGKVEPIRRKFRGAGYHKYSDKLLEIQKVPGTPEEVFAGISTALNKIKADEPDAYRLAKVEMDEIIKYAKSINYV